MIWLKFELLLLNSCGDLRNPFIGETFLPRLGMMWRFGWSFVCEDSYPTPYTTSFQEFLPSHPSLSFCFPRVFMGYVLSRQTGEIVFALWPLLETFILWPCRVGEMSSCWRLDVSGCSCEVGPVGQDFRWFFMQEPHVWLVTLRNYEQSSQCVFLHQCCNLVVY